MPVALLRVGQGDRIDWKSFLRIAAPLALAVGLLTAYSPLLGALILLPGSVFLAVHVYRRRTLGPLRAAQGARMGAVVGTISFAVLAVLFAASVAYDPAGYRQQVESQVKEALARNPSPQAQQVVQNLFSGPRGIALLLAMGMAVTLVFLLVISSVSGALAASLVRNKSGP